MKQTGTIQIETSRLTLRRFIMSDAPAAFYNWANDSEVTTFLTWLPHQSIDETERVLSDWISNYENKKFYFHWAIVLKENGDAPIGAIGVVKMNEDIDMVHIGYCIGRKWWHQGITTEAFQAIIPYLIEHAGVNRIESRHDPRNPNSGKVMLKCGLQYEGTLRQADKNNQGICDAAMYALLRDN